MGERIIRWTDVIVETARTMWSEGHSARDIAMHIGTTRNAVIGKLNRMNLLRAPRPPSPNGTTRTRRTPVLRIRRVTPARPQSSPRSISRRSRKRPKLITDLQYGECRWPIGDTPFKFCGKHVLGSGCSYCAKHTALAYMPSKPRVVKYLVKAASGKMN